MTTNREHLIATARDIGTEAYWLENTLSNYNTMRDTYYGGINALKRIGKLRGLLDTAEATIGRIEQEKAAVTNGSEGKNG